MLKVKPFLFILFLTVFVALFTTACSDTGSNSSGGIYDNSTTNPGGGDTENPGGGDTENPGGGDTENPGGGDTENPGGGEEDKPGVTAIDLAGNPFSLLGVYDVTLYGIDEEPVTTPAAKSELRVGLNLATAAGGMTAPEVIMYLDFEGKKITFDKYIIELPDLANSGGDLGQFIADTFANLGAELIENSKYGLYFTLDPNKNPNYSPVIDNLIIKNGQYLKLKLDKAKDLEVDSGLGLDEETPTDPEEPENPEEPVVVPVDSVTIKGQQAVVHGGASFQLTAEVLPNDATNKVVTWASSNPDYIAVDTQGNVTIKGYTAETITITATSTADKTKTDSWKFNIEKATVTAISVTPADMTLTLKNDGSEVSANITTAIEPAIATDYTTVNYAVTSGAEYIKVDANGVVTAVAEGSAVVTVTVGSLTKTVNVTVNPAPSVEIPVTNITVTTSADKVYKKGTNVTINFTLTPTTTTDTMVSYTTQSGSGNLPTSNGTGSFELTNVQGGETVTFTTAKGQQATYTINAVDGINAISFENNEVTKEQNTVFTNNIVDYDTLSNSIASWTYSSDDESIASVDPVTGQVTAKKNGVTTIRVTAQPKYDAEPLPAEFQIDVLGHIDFSSNEAFMDSIEGTYQLTFFGTKPGKGVKNGKEDKITDATVTTDCTIQNSLFGGECAGEGGFWGVGSLLEVAPNDYAGIVTVQKADNGYGIKIVSKMLMTEKTMRERSQNDQYQYTVYNYTSYTTPAVSDSVQKGVKGRNLSQPFDFPNTDFRIEENSDKLTLQLYYQIFGKEIELKNTVIYDGTYVINPKTYVLAKKISSQPETLHYSDVSSAPFSNVKGVSPAVADLGDTAPTY